MSDKQSTPQPDPTYESNAEETDTRIWLHICKSPLRRFYIYSPDTYHIGLPLDHGDKEILLEINGPGSTQKRIISLSNLMHNLVNNPDLSIISPCLLPQVLQTLYVVTGSDYTSFFLWIWKGDLHEVFLSTC